MAFFSHVGGGFWTKRPPDRPFRGASAAHLFLAPGLLDPVPLSRLAPAIPSRSRRPHAHPPPPQLRPRHAAGPPQEAGHHFPRAGRHLRRLRPPLRPPLLPLPPRRPPPHRPAPHPQGARQDPLRLRPQGVAPRGPHRAR